MSQVSERYAQSLYEVAKNKNTVESTLEILMALGKSIEDHEDIQTVLASPLITNNDKVSIVTSALQGHVSEELKTFFELLAKNNRIENIPEIVDSFNRIVEKVSGVVSGVVTSALDLNEQEKNDVQKTIEDKLGHKVQLKFTINKKMIGGIEARVGSYIFEDSIKSHMQKLNDYITRRVQ